MRYLNNLRVSVDENDLCSGKGEQVLIGLSANWEFFICGCKFLQFLHPFAQAEKVFSFLHLVSS